MIRGGPLTVFHLGLGDGSPEINVPQCRGFLAVGLAALHVPQEGALADAAAALVDGGVVLLPVDADAEAAVKGFEDLLVLLDEFVAQFQEIRSRDRHGLVLLRWVAAERRLEAGFVGVARVATHAKKILHATFGGQAVVVPPHRVEDLLALHPLVAGDDVGVGVAEDVTHVQRPADGGGWGVDGKDIAPYC